MNYEEFQQSVYEWLFNKYLKDNTFCFSTRQSATKNAELNFFIGTKKSNYLGTTFWVIPVAYPGSAGDLIDIFIDFHGDKFSAELCFNQTKTPHNQQNKLALKFIHELKNTFKENKISILSSLKDVKYENYKIILSESTDDINVLFHNIEKDLNQYITIIDKSLGIFKQKNSTFEAKRIDNKLFETFQNKLKVRFKKYNGPDISTITTLGIPKDNDEPIREEKMTNSEPFLNTILYGPPGTGKTYNSVNYALSIIENTPLGELELEERGQVMNRFEQYQKAGQIEFVTFHSNYSYEDFVEGIKPDVQNSNQLLFKRIPGVFKRIAKTAQEHFEPVKINSVLQTQEPNKDSFENFLIFLKSEITAGKGEIKRANSILTIENIDDKDVHFLIPKGKGTAKCSRNSLHTYYNKCLEMSEDERKNFFKANNSYEIHVLRHHFAQFLNENNNVYTDSTASVESKKYVIIIDEINRANISRVFGELITLIEPDKRIGKTNQLNVTLPSGDKFGVPPNLYIIGTMNTADKSIALVDIALRRRFHFVPMYPKLSLAGEFSSLLENLNKAIYKEKNSADFFIGHSYFMSKEGLSEIINNNIIPLLMEYFPNKQNKVRDILKAANVETEEDNNHQVIYKP